MENEKLISVVIPIYNVEQYLQRCLDSVRNQTYSNLEIILINDGSQDNSEEICKQNAEEDNRIKIISQKNRGVSVARNAGVKAATGEYLVFVDSDDFVSHKMVECLCRVLVEEDADIAVCEYQRAVDEETAKFEEYDRGRTIYSNNEAMHQFYDTYYIQLTVSWNKLYKRSLFQEIEYPEGKIHEDEYASWKLIMKSKKIVYIYQNLYFYQKREESIVGQGVKWVSFDKVPAYKERVSFFETYGDKRLLESACYRYIRVYEKLCEQVLIEEPLDFHRIYEHLKVIKQEMKLYRKMLTLEHRIKAWIVWGYVKYKRKIQEWKECNVNQKEVG